MLLFWYRRVLILGSALGQSADSAGGEAELHPTETLGLEVNGKRTARVALGMANVVSGLGTPAGELADAAHSSVLKAIIENKPWRLSRKKSSML